MALSRAAVPGTEPPTEPAPASAQIPAAGSTPAFQEPAGPVAAAAQENASAPSFKSIEPQVAAEASSSPAEKAHSLGAAPAQQTEVPTPEPVTAEPATAKLADPDLPPALAQAPKTQAKRRLKFAVL